MVKKWTPEIEKRIGERLESEPEKDLNWRTWTPREGRRSERVAY